MRFLVCFGLLSFSSLAFANCEGAKLNDADKIFEAYSCNSISLEGAKKIENFCIVKAKTIESDGEIFQYTHMWGQITLENNNKNIFSTFKWHHKKNNAVSKMWEDSLHIKMKDITATDFMKANIYKLSDYDKKTKLLEIEAYVKKTFIGLKKRKWYSANFECEKINLMN